VRTRDPEPARRNILEAADRLLRRGTPGTVDQVAREAACAKGLVHYHFRTKAALLAAVAKRLGDARCQRWDRTFVTKTPRDAVRASWDLLLAEHADGTLRAWLALMTHRDKQTGQAVSAEVQRFATSVTQAASRWLQELGLEATIPLEEIGFLLAAVVWGTGFLLAAGIPPSCLQGAYDAAWAGVLSLTRPARASTKAGR